MRAKLKSLHSSDIDLDSFWPSDPKDFGFQVEAYIGPEDGEGAESFGMTVCTPSWLSKKLLVDGYRWGWHHLIVAEYDKGIIKSAIARYAERCLGSTWAEVAQKLAPIGRWEFEGYPDAD